VLVAAVSRAAAAAGLSAGRSASRPAAVESAVKVLKEGLGAGSRPPPADARRAERSLRTSAGRGDRGGGAGGGGGWMGHQRPCSLAAGLADLTHCGRYAHSESRHCLVPLAGGLNFCYLFSRGRMFLVHGFAEPILTGRAGQNQCPRQ
jgi:hypothetical protein